jgi:hypothetical protein
LDLLPILAEKAWIERSGVKVYITRGRTGRLLSAFSAAMNLEQAADAGASGGAASVAV